MCASSEAARRSKANRKRGGGGVTSAYASGALFVADRLSMNEISRIIKREVGRNGAARAAQKAA